VEEVAIRARIRELLETKTLPCDEPRATWAGNGGGQRCVACTNAIAPTEIEFEVDLASGLTLRLHRRCHDIWRQECAPAPSP
jgi:hypothetical protein